MPRHQWILLELFCGLLVQVANTSGDTRIESLITIKQRDDGVELSVFPKYFGIKSTGSEPTLTKLVSGQQLSRDCGDQYFRCKPLPVSTQNASNDTAYHLFVPLNGGVLIMELKLSANKSEIVFGSYRMLETRDCSPTTIFELYDSHYTICTNLRNKLVSLYEIRVNKTSLEQTEMRPIVTVEQLADFTDASDVVNMSDFLVSTDVPHQPLIYFAVDNYLFAIDLLDYSVYFDFIQIGTTRCRHIHRLTRVSSSQILAYCSSEFVYFDTEQENWVSEHSYTESGVPYLCPNEMYGVKAFQDYLEYSIGTRKGILSHVNVDSGVCFSRADGQNFFVYNDRVNDTTTLMNFTSDRQTVAQMQLCKNHDCLPIIAVKDPVQYLIIRQPSGDGRVNVLDVEENFSTIISANHEAADMFTIVHIKAPLYPSHPGLPPREQKIMIIGVVFGILITITVITVAIIFATIFGHKILINKWPHTQQRNTVITQEIAIPLPESQGACIVSNHHAHAFEAPQGQPQCQAAAVPCPVSPSGDRANSMPTGGNSNSNLGQFGEEEEKLQQEKQLSEDLVITLIDDEKPDPDVMLCGSSSLATDLSSDPVTKPVYVSGPIATTAADSVSDDTGSEDSIGMNSDREPLLENQ